MIGHSLYARGEGMEKGGELDNNYRTGNKYTEDRNRSVSTRHGKGYMTRQACRLYTKILCVDERYMATREPNGIIHTRLDLRMYVL